MSERRRRKKAARRERRRKPTYYEEPTTTTPTTATPAPTNACGSVSVILNESNAASRGCLEVLTAGIQRKYHLDVRREGYCDASGGTILCIEVNGSIEPDGCAGLLGDALFFLEDENLDEECKVVPSGGLF